MADTGDADADAAAVHSRAELEANLAEYQSQLEQVDALLSSEADNAEYVELKSGLVEVIALTKDLLTEAVAVEERGGGIGGGGGGGDGGGGAGGGDGGGGGGEAAATTMGAPSESHQAPPRKRKSRWEQLPTPAEETAAPSSETATAGAAASAATTTTTAAAGPRLAPPPPSPAAAGIDDAAGEEGAPDDEEGGEEPERYRAPELPKRKGAEAPSSEADAAAIAAEVMPKWLEIKPGDDEKEIDRKKKKQKAWKSKRRLAERDLEARRKQASWQAFSGGGVGKKKKKVGGAGGGGVVGSSTGGSMYSVPMDDPLRRVGVVAAPKRTE